METRNKGEFYDTFIEFKEELKDNIAEMDKLRARSELDLIDNKVS